MNDDTSKPWRFGDDMTLREARDLLRERVGDGETCPCCAQFAKVYRRKISGTMARRLRDFRTAVPAGEFGHLPTVLGRGSDGEFAKLRYWGLIAEERRLRRDDGGRAGFWKVTQLGEDFIAGRITVPMYAHVYDGRRLSLSGKEVSFVETLGEPFDYSELMALEGDPIGVLFEDLDRASERVE
jgi:hypothetical protein